MEFLNVYPISSYMEIYNMGNYIIQSISSYMEISYMAIFNVQTGLYMEISNTGILTNMQYHHTWKYLIY